jgi:NADPH2:quinone reductase
MDDVHAAALVANYTTAEIAISVFAELKPTDAVLVHAAAGSLGSACIQLARVHGCGTIVGTAGGPEKAARVLGIGADVAVDYLADDFVVATREATGGAGANVCFESVGGDVLGRTFDCMAPAGRIVCLGASSGRSSDRFRLHTLFEKGVSVSGFTVGLWIDAGVPAVEEATQRVLRYATEGAISPVIAGVYGPDDVAEAHRLFEGRGAVGRVVVEL